LSILATFLLAIASLLTVMALVFLMIAEKYSPINLIVNDSSSKA
jgi:hypothetical protein